MGRYSFELEDETIIDYQQMHNDLVTMMSILDDAGADEYGNDADDRLLDAIISAVDCSRMLY